MKLTIALETHREYNDEIRAEAYEGLVAIETQRGGHGIAVFLSSFEARVLARALLDMAEKLEAPVISYKAQAIVEAPVVRYDAPGRFGNCPNCGKILGNHVVGLQGVYCSDDCLKQAGDLPKE